MRVVIRSGPPARDLSRARLWELGGAVAHTEHPRAPERIVRMVEGPDGSVEPIDLQQVLSLQVMESSDPTREHVEEGGTRAHTDGARKPEDARHLLDAAREVHPHEAADDSRDAQ